MTTTHAFEPATMDEAAHMLRAANGVYCFVCRRTAWPMHLTYKHLTVCGRDAPSGQGREAMNDVTEQEAAAGMDGIDRAGAYLDSIGKFDLRDLTDKQLAEFNAHWLSGYSESMGERAAVAPPF